MQLSNSHLRNKLRLPYKEFSVVKSRFEIEYNSIISRLAKLNALGGTFGVMTKIQKRPISSSILGKPRPRPLNAIDRITASFLSPYHHDVRIRTFTLTGSVGYPKIQSYLPKKSCQVYLLDP